MAGYKGRQGRKPTPTVVKFRRGTLRQDRTNAAEPQPERKAPTMPSWLQGYARTVWRRLVRELEQLGVIAVTDREAMACYCLAVAELRESLGVIEAEGRTFTTPNGFIQPHPAVGMRNKAIEQIRVLAVEFGLTPSSRTRIHALPPPAGRDDGEETEEEVAKRLLGPR